MEISHFYDVTNLSQPIKSEVVYSEEYSQLIRLENIDNNQCQSGAVNNSRDIQDPKRFLLTKNIYYVLSFTDRQTGDRAQPCDGEAERVHAEVSDQGGLQSPHCCRDGDEEPRAGPSLSHRLHRQSQRGRSSQDTAGELVQLRIYG